MEKYSFNEIQSGIMQKSPIPFAIYQYEDKRIKTIMLSDGFLHLFNIKDHELGIHILNSDMHCRTHPDDIARISDAAIRFAENEEPYDVVYRLDIDGSYKVIHAIGQHLYTEDDVRLSVVWYTLEGDYVGNNILQSDSLINNLSIQLYESTLQRKSNFDFLTGLPNMTYFFDLVRTKHDQMHSEGKSCCLGFANLNGMKYYNKKHGFAEGDNLLRGFAKFLVKYFSSEGCCRIGQDNFAFIGNTDTVETVLTSLIKEFTLFSNSKSITVRIGIYPDTIEDVETSLACDRARYACNVIKNTNVSNYIFFNESMLKYETNRQYVIDNLDRALAENWLTAFYQPIVRAANGRVCDEEALARWIDPVKGILSPAEFIPILEDAKLIYKVDLHMVDLVIERLKAQAKSGLYIVPISVNLSRTDFDSCDIVNEICQRMDAAGIAREKLTIEITESVLGSDFDFMKKQIERFKELGFRVWMDDFGSGYSSLDVLQDIHFDLIKLDMRFMKRFYDEKSKIIITELVKMAVNLDIQTITEGVEYAEQVDFLTEIGCTKLQGYYFCKPIPYEQILHRNEVGEQIGFENPDETEYYESIGRLNLYDININIESDRTGFSQYFNTLPMAILEANEEKVRYVRVNKSYKSFLQTNFDNADIEHEFTYKTLEDIHVTAFARAIKRCITEKNKAFLDESISDSASVHAVISPVAVNPVTGVTACSLVILGVINESSQLTYADIADSLSSDYIYLYYVDTENETFVEYAHNKDEIDLSVERHGDNFFEASKHDAPDAIYAEDLCRFITSFTKENVLNSIEKYGSYTITYRLMTKGEPVYVNMKAIKMRNKPNHIIIGVNNVDAQMKKQEAIQRMHEEQIAYSRITALSKDIICIYTVDPETEKYVEYISTKNFDSLGLDKSGENFFEVSLIQGAKTIYHEDMDFFKSMFKKDIVLREIENNGVFMINYRLVMENKPIYVCLRAAIIQENDGPKLIVGVSNTDAQVRRDMNYEKYLAEQADKEKKN